MSQKPIDIGRKFWVAAKRERAKARAKKAKAGKTKGELDKYFNRNTSENAQEVLEETAQWIRRQPRQPAWWC